MVSYWALLVLAVALWCLRVIASSVLDFYYSKRSCLLFTPPANPPSHLHFGIQEGERSSLGLNMQSVVHEIGKIEPIHLLFVGRCRPYHFVSEEILDIPGFKVSTVLDYRDLIETIHNVPSLVLVHDSLPPIELEDACRLVRQTWPFARILVIHDGEEFLEDFLYDDRIPTDVSGKDLIARILFLVQALDLWRPNNGRR